MCDRLRGHFETNILILDSTICFLDEAQYLSILHYVKYPNFYSAHYAGTISAFCPILFLNSDILQILHISCTYFVLKFQDYFICPVQIVHIASYSLECHSSVIGTV